MAFAAALSQHPVTAHAMGEAAGQLLEDLGPEPDLALLFVTRHHAGALEDAANVVRAVLRPRTLLGCAAVAVVGGRREVEEGPGISLWAGRVGDVTPFLLPPAADGQAPLTGWPPPQPAAAAPTAALLLADPYTFPAEPVLDAVAARHPGLPVLGGMASAADGPGGNRLLLDDRVVTGGAVGVLLGGAVEVEPVVSQGCRPVGRPLSVTRSDGPTIFELGGRPALQRLQELAEHDLSPEEIALVNRGGLHVGRVVDEHKADFERGDFLVRNVLGGNREQGWIAVADTVEIGTTLQFHLRDAAAADEDLRLALTPRAAEAALLFTCNGRGRRLFGEPDHDAAAVGDALGDPPVAGFFCAGELGPVGGRNFVHGFTASLALLRSIR